MPTNYDQQQADRLMALKSALIGKTIASISLFPDLFCTDYGELSICFTDDTSLTIIGDSPLRFESPTVKIDPD